MTGQSVIEACRILNAADFVKLGRRLFNKVVRPDTELLNSEVAALWAYDYLCQRVDRPKLNAAFNHLKNSLQEACALIKIGSNEQSPVVQIVVVDGRYMGCTGLMSFFDMLEMESIHKVEQPFELTSYNVTKIFFTYLSSDNANNNKEPAGLQTVTG
jgi:hypothetical protein